MFFDSLLLTILIFIIVALVAYGNYFLIKKEGGRPLKKREYIGITIVLILVFAGAIYAFSTDFGRY